MMLTMLEEDMATANLEADWEFVLRRARESLAEGFHPTDWCGPWRELFTAHHELTSVPGPQRTIPQRARLTDAQQELRRAARGRLQQLVAAWEHDHGPLSAARLCESTADIPGPVRRWFLGLSAEDRQLPLQELSDGRRERWVVLDGQNLHGARRINRTGIGYWAVVTVPAVIEQPGEWGTVSVHRVSALVADILSRSHGSLECGAAVARGGDTLETLVTALRLWEPNRYDLNPLSEWSAAVKAARHITG